MKRGIFLVIVGLTTIFAFGQKVENLSVSDFNGIDASYAFEITVKKGSTEALTIEANDDVMPYVRSEVKNGILYLYLEKDIPNSVRNKTVNATVIMKDLEKVSLSGACKIKANDLFTPKTFNASCSGASSIAINVNTGKLSIKASGTSELQINASVTDDTKMNLSGSSNVDLIGSAKSLSLDMSGSSNFKAGDFITETSTIKSSGSSKVLVNVTKTLNISSSGSSAVDYKGSPSVSVNSSGSSKVKKI